MQHQTSTHHEMTASSRGSELFTPSTWRQQPLHQGPAVGGGHPPPAPLGMHIPPFSQPPLSQTGAPYGAPNSYAFTPATSSGPSFSFTMTPPALQSGLQAGGPPVRLPELSFDSLGGAPFGSDPTGASSTPGWQTLPPAPGSTPITQEFLSSLLLALENRLQARFEDFVRQGSGPRSSSRGEGNVAPIKINDEHEQLKHHEHYRELSKTVRSAVNTFFCISPTNPTPMYKEVQQSKEMADVIASVNRTHSWAAAYPRGVREAIRLHFTYLREVEKTTHSPERMARRKEQHQRSNEKKKRRSEKDTPSHKDGPSDEEMAQRHNEEPDNQPAHSTEASSPSTSHRMSRPNTPTA
eukprot:m.180992 g.180992  ORF g.180992 m.180992 type:complete len:352 (+) comp9992_c0_seq34:5956-7011(+)